jgi:ABC-type oligopeptide transport system ATPase subunit
MNPASTGQWPLPLATVPGHLPRPFATLAPLLSVRGLCKYFPVLGPGIRRRVTGLTREVEDLSFDLAPGESLGLVGESKYGKTTAARCILRAIEPTAGDVFFRQPDGVTVNLARLSARELKPVRKHVQMVFQDPFSSLNPRMTVRDIVGEPLVIHRIARGAELDDRVSEVLARVGLRPEHRARYPHAFSGGQRQRIGIARALIMRPSLIVCDEATSALDVSIQAQVLDLLKELQRDFRLTYLFVAHNLDVVRGFCDRVAVMRKGRVVELAPTADVFAAPQHPYTKILLSAVPSPDPDVPMNFNVGDELAKLDAVG